MAFLVSYERTSDKGPQDLSHGYYKTRNIFLSVLVGRVEPAKKSGRRLLRLFKRRGGSSAAAAVRKHCWIWQDICASVKKD